MRYLDADRVLRMYRRIIEQTGGAAGLRDAGALDSSLAQPRMTFGGKDLYPTIIDKAAALAFSLIKNHPFTDGNKRIGFAAMDAFLRLNGLQVRGDVDELESVILDLAAGDLGREDFNDWLAAHVVPRGGGRRQGEAGNPDE